MHQTNTATTTTTTTTTTSTTTDTHTNTCTLAFSCTRHTRHRALRHHLRPQGDVAAVQLLLAHADKVEASDMPDPRRLVIAANLAALAPCHVAAWRGHGSALREVVKAGAAAAVGGRRARAGCGRARALQGQRQLPSPVATRCLFFGRGRADVQIMCQLTTIVPHHGGAPQRLARGRA